jgi:hypothetical protein
LLLHHSTRLPGLLAICALVSLLASGCAVLPPDARYDSPAGTVRAEEAEQAALVAAQLEELHPRVQELLPDTLQRDFEVWVQKEPRMYLFAGPSYEEADGFWAEGPSRIHLRASAASLERTLAHELVHASLGDSWSLLPGTLEEGLCDWVSAQLVPEGAAEMRAGRLSAASFATGGLEFDVELSAPATAGIELAVGARVLLTGGMVSELTPEQVFEVRAGLSTTRLDSGAKKAFYGLSYLVVERIIDRRGITGLHGMCLQAEREGLDEVPTDWLLRAAGLDDAQTADWRTAIHEALGADEVRLLVHAYPELLRGTLERFFEDLSESEDDLRLVRAVVRIPDTEVAVPFRF